MDMPFIAGEQVTIYSETLYEDWYVIQVRNKREYFVKQLIDKYLDNSVQLIIFSRQILHKKNDRYMQLTLPIFAGYIFVHKDIGKVMHVARLLFKDEFVSPVRFNNELAKVSVNEMKFLLSNAGSDGIFKISYVYREGDSITVTQGPLKNINGKIVFINEKKRKAKVHFFLFNQTMDISLGIDFIERGYAS
jgi:transcription termination/antitermination protein NusG